MRYQDLEHAMTLIRNGQIVHSPLEKALVEEIDRLRGLHGCPKISSAASLQAGPSQANN